MNLGGFQRLGKTLWRYQSPDGWECLMEYFGHGVLFSSPRMPTGLWTLRSTGNPDGVSAPLGSCCRVCHKHRPAVLVHPVNANVMREERAAWLQTLTWHDRMALASAGWAPVTDAATS